MEINMEARQQTGERIRAELWPSLPYEAWKDTRDTLHMWTQIVGKVRMELSPFFNHWWHVTLYDSPLGGLILSGIHGLLARAGHPGHDQHLAQRSTESHSLRC